MHTKYKTVFFLNSNNDPQCAHAYTRRNNKSSAVAEMGDHLATTDMGRKVGERAAVGGSSVPHLTQCVLGRGLTPYQVASWSIQLFGHNTPTIQTDRQDNGHIAKSELFYKQLPKNY